MYLNSDEIKALAHADVPVITDFVNKKVSMVEGRIVASYGLAENCYDVRIAEHHWNWLFLQPVLILIRIIMLMRYWISRKTRVNKKS